MHGNTAFWIPITLALLIASAHSAEREPYVGPLNLKWGMSVEDAVSVLPAHYRKVQDRNIPKERTRELVFEGEFANNKGHIHLSFLDGQEFFGLAFVPRVPIGDPASRHVLRFVDQMAARHGKPDTEVPPPERKSNEEMAQHIRDPEMRKRWAEMGREIDLLSSGYEDLDADILTAAWKPAYVWTFPNATIMVSTTLELGPLDMGEIRPIWVFVEKERMQKVAEHAEAHSDF